MSWTRMSFKGESVWVRVDERGQLVLDSEGRAEMRYRPEDKRSYRPRPQNLTPARPGEGEDASTPSAPRSTAPAPSGAAAVEVWTDGACSGNPGPMGIGVVVLAGGQRHEHSEYLGVGTNNIAELVAIQRGLELAEKVASGRPVRLHSDSGYALGLLGKGWKAKANQDLVARLRRMLAGRSDVSLIKVAGHAGVPENERCDELARQAIVERRSA